MLQEETRQVVHELNLQEVACVVERDQPAVVQPVALRRESWHRRGRHDLTRREIDERLVIQSY